MTFFSPRQKTSGNAISVVEAFDTAVDLLNLVAGVIGKKGIKVVIACELDVGPDGKIVFRSNCKVIFSGFPSQLSAIERRICKQVIEHHAEAMNNFAKKDLV